MRYEKCRKNIGDLLIITWNDGTITYFNALSLGCAWFKMSNDAFYEIYGFGWSPHEIPGLYERCRAAVYSGADI